jgi:NAD-dependent SIR2 family protein deacetylase
MSDLSFHPASTTLEESWGLGVTMARAFCEHEPHEGYSALFELCKSSHFFVVTSNIDGYFKRSGFPPDRLWETHGCMDTLQCTTVGQDHYCGVGTWALDKDSLEKIPIRVDNTCARDTIPICKKCGALARPNVSHATGVMHLNIKYQYQNLGKWPTILRNIYV